MVEGSPTCPVTSDDRQTSPPDTSLSLARGGSGAGLLPSPLKSPTSECHTHFGQLGLCPEGKCLFLLPSSGRVQRHLYLPSLNNNLKAKAKKEKWLFQIPQIQSCQKIKTNRSHRAIRSARYTGSRALGYFPHYALHTLSWAQRNCIATDQMCLAAASKVDAG